MLNPLMFPKMLVSHGEGWAFLDEVHPSVAKTFLLWVLPLSVIPPAMLLYAWDAYHEHLSEISRSQAMAIAGLFFVTELVVVPVMGAVIRRLGDVVGARPDYHDAFMLAAIAPTPLWIAPLALMVPSLLVNLLVLSLALMGSATLIYQGVYQTYHVEDEGRSLLLAGSVLAAGLVAWVSLMILTFVSWGLIILRP